ncbi:MAG TPA: hypothetical protein VE967_12215 [Gemmatimonadaceae bacterium]|nr:hypothetical protein [Gemmatimonadaceae bacterium]
MILLMGGLVGAGVLFWSLKQQRLWTTTFALVPEVETSTGSSVLAQELGLSSSASQGPDFYAEFLRSDEAFYDLVRRKYARQGGKDSVSLPDLLQIPPMDSAVRFKKTIRSMLIHSTALVSRRSGMVNVAVSLPDPMVSKQVADSLVAAITALNDRTRQNKGRSEREFAQKRLQIARNEYEAAFDTLRDFLEKNRGTLGGGGSPTLNMERARRESFVAQKQALMNSVELAYETARTEEVRNTPRVSVIVRPRPAVTGDPRGTVGRTVVAFIVTVGAFIVLYWLADRFGDGSVFRMLGRGAGRLATSSRARA